MRLVSQKRNNTTLSQLILKRSTNLIPLKIYLSGLLVFLLLSLFFSKAALIQDDHLIAHCSKLMTLSHSLENYAEEEREKQYFFPTDYFFNIFLK